MTHEFGIVQLSGSLTADGLPEFGRLLAGLPCAPGLELQLGELEMEGPAALAGALVALRALARRCGGLRLHGAPQLLAHSLYRVAALDSGGITLLEPREEEPYG